MRWITFVILLYVAAALQLARFGALSPAGKAFPVIEYLPLLAIFYALYASEEHAPLPAIWCGLVYDLFSADLFGIATLSLALVCWTVTRIRLSIFREHLISQFVIVLVAVGAFGTVGGILRHLAPLLVGGAKSPYGFFQILGRMAANALYTALVAPAIFWVLFRFSSLLGFSTRMGRAR